MESSRLSGQASAGVGCTGRARPRGRRGGMERQATRSPRRVPPPHSRAVPRRTLVESASPLISRASRAPASATEQTRSLAVGNKKKRDVDVPTRERMSASQH